MAVDDRKVGVFMFLPAVAYIGLLIGVPLLLAVLYAFSDARIGTMGFHFVGLENFRSILQSPSFRAALRNSVVFTISRADHRDCGLQHSFHRTRTRISWPLVRAVADLIAVGGADFAGRDWMEVDSGFDLQRHHLGAGLGAHFQALWRADVAWRANVWRWLPWFWFTPGG